MAETGIRVPFKTHAPSSANSIPALTCSRSSPSNHSIRSSILAPASRFFKDGGDRHPRTLQNPRTELGKLDTRLDLFAVKPVEPFHKVVDIGPGFQVFQRWRRPASAYPSKPTHRARQTRYPP